MDQGEHAGWIHEVEPALERTGRMGAEVVSYIRQHRIRISVRPQSAGARWTPDRRIEIHPQYAGDLPVSAYGMSLVVHEVRHLQQGPVIALSVYGELDAWRTQFDFLRGLSARIPGSYSQRQLVERLLAIPLAWDREMLSAARRIMREYAGRKYRVDLLPLYPIHLELAHAVSGRTPAQH